MLINIKLIRPCYETENTFKNFPYFNIPRNFTVNDAAFYFIHSFAYRTFLGEFVYLVLAVEILLRLPGIVVLLVVALKVCILYVNILGTYIRTIISANSQL